MSDSRFHGKYILSRCSPPMRLHQWILCHNAYSFWRSFCNHKTSLVILDPRDICPDVNLEDIPIKEIQNIRLNKLIEKYQESVSKEKRYLEIRTESSKMNLVIHNIVMVMELKQRKFSAQTQEKEMSDSKNNLYEPITHNNLMTVDDVQQFFGSADKLETFFGDFQNSFEQPASDQIPDSIFKSDFLAEETTQNTKDNEWVEEVRSKIETMFDETSFSDDNVLLRYIDSEEKKFKSYVQYMAQSVKDPIFIESVKEYNLFGNSPTTSASSNIIASTTILPTDFQDVEEKMLVDEIDDILNEEDSNEMDVDGIQNKSKDKIYDTALQQLYAKKNEYSNLPQFRVNLQSIACATIKLGSQYNQRKFASVSCRSNFFQLTIGIYPYGTISSTGSTHEIASIMAFQNIINILRDIYGPLAFEDPYVKLNNLVLSGQTGYRICTDLLTNRYPSYFRKIKGFSGIAFINRARVDTITLLIFRRGSICVSGGRSIESVVENTKLALTMLEQCKETVENLEIEKSLTSTVPIQPIYNPVSETKSKRGRRETKKKT